MPYAEFNPHRWVNSVQGCGSQGSRFEVRFLDPDLPTAKRHRTVRDQFPLPVSGSSSWTQFRGRVPNHVCHRSQSSHAPGAEKKDPVNRSSVRSPRLDFKVFALIFTPIQILEGFSMRCKSEVLISAMVLTVRTSGAPSFADTHQTGPMIRVPPLCAGPEAVWVPPLSFRT